MLHGFQGKFLTKELHLQQPVKQLTQQIRYWSSQPVSYSFTKQIKRCIQCTFFWFGGGARVLRVVAVFIFFLPLRQRRPQALQRVWAQQRHQLKYECQLVVGNQIVHLHTLLLRLYLFMIKTSHLLQVINPNIYQTLTQCQDSSCEQSLHIFYFLFFVP